MRTFSGPPAERGSANKCAWAIRARRLSSPEATNCSALSLIPERVCQEALQIGIDRARAMRAATDRQGRLPHHSTQLSEPLSLTRERASGATIAFFCNRRRDARVRVQKQNSSLTGLSYFPRMRLLRMRRLRARAWLGTCLRLRARRRFARLRCFDACFIGSPDTQPGRRYPSTERRSRERLYFVMLSPQGESPLSDRRPLRHCVQPLLLQVLRSREKRSLP